MGGVYRRKKTHYGRKEFYRSCRTCNRTKDLDQIQEDLVPENTVKLLREVVDEELPGGGQFLCVECSRHFINQANLDEHKTGKLHKKRVRKLKEPAYTIEEANAAGGSGANAFYGAKLEKIKPAFATHAEKSSRAYKRKPEDKDTQPSAASLMAYE